MPHIMVNRLVILAPVLAVAVSLSGCGNPKITYKGLKLTRKGVEEVRKEDVSRYLLQMRSGSATGSPLTPGRAVGKGNRVLIDFAGTIGGSPFQGGSHSGFRLVLGSGQMIPGFEEGIMGMKPGETRNIEVAFPETYHEPSLASRTAVFAVTVRGAEKLSLPPLDADFVRKATGGQITTVSALRKAIEERLYQNRLEQADRSLKMQAAEMLLVQWEKEPSKREIDDALDQVVQQQLQAASRQGSGPQGMPDVEMIRKTYGATIIKNLKLAKILATIAEQENIEVSDQEVEQAAARLAQSQGQNPQQFIDELRRNNQFKNMRSRIVEERAMSLILQNAQIEEVQ